MQQQASTSMMSNNNSIGTPTTFNSSLTITKHTNKKGQLFEGTPPSSMPYEKEGIDENIKSTAEVEGLSKSGGAEKFEEKSIVVQFRPQSSQKPQQIDIVRYSMQNMIASGGGTKGKLIYII